MNNQLHEALLPIRATVQMKHHTCDFLHTEIAKRQRKCFFLPRYAVACCAALFLMVCAFGGYRFYTTPVSYISVDVNPSVELGLNRLDTVVTVEAYNDDGARVLENLRLKNKPYTEAIELLLADEEFERYLTQDALLSFSVVSDKEEVLLAGIQQCHGYVQAGAECHSANTQIVEQAHHNGVSFGKYQAFLRLSQYDKTITIEDCKELSMRQMRDMISQYESGTESLQDIRNGNNQCDGWDGGHHGTDGHGYRYRGGEANGEK